MKLRIPKDFFDNPTPPRLFLCNTGKKIMGQLPAYNTGLNASWNKYAELSFSIDRQYTDIITGQTVINPLFDKAEGLRKVYVENMGYFIIQDPKTTYSDKDTKVLSCFSSEYETSTKYLENFYVNTGDDESVEVTYLEGIYGAGYTVNEDDRYQVVPLVEDMFDPYESYYVKRYTDNDSYIFEQKQIVDVNAYVTSNETLYIKKYPNVRFYWPTKPQLSLLHLIFKKIPDWTIGNVDVSLWRKERKFSEDRVAVYDFLMDNVADTVKCVVEWDTLNNRVNFYEEAEDGVTEDNTIQTRFDTDIYITRENLANEINISYSSDDIKTKLKVMGSDDLSIRDINLGKNHIINLDFYHNSDWMEDDLWEAYDNYLSIVDDYSELYAKAVSARAAAYNRWNDLMNAVPAEGNVVLIGDPFEKLYCLYTPTDTAYYNGTIIKSSSETSLSDLYSVAIYTEENKINKTNLNNGDPFIVQGYQFEYQDGQFVYVRDIIGRDDVNGKPTDGTKKAELIKQLSLYHVNDDVNGNAVDNILLRLKDKDSNTITIRIYAPPEEIAEYKINKKYYKGDNGVYTQLTNVSESNFASYIKQYGVLYTNSENYMIRYESSNATTGVQNDKLYTELIYWLKGMITIDNPEGVVPINLKDYNVSYIGTMGAYFVLAKDEKEEANLEDYGVMLLREKRDTYTALFQTQTENMYSQDKHQCTVSDTEPSTDGMPNGTRWLDTSGDKVVLKIYQDGLWKESSVNTEDQYNYENYQRYIDNYDKLVAVQKVLAKKEAEAEYCLNGYAVSDMRIDLGYVRATDYNSDYTYYVDDGGIMNQANPQPTIKNFDQRVYYINQSDFPPPNYMNSDGYSIQGVFHIAAQKHFAKNQIVSDGDIRTEDLNKKAYVPLYTFTHPDYPNTYIKANTYKDGVVYYIDQYGSQVANPQPTAENFVPNKYYIIEKDNTFAVYLNGKTPYIAFASSVGVNQAKMDKYSQATDFEDSFSLNQWTRLSPLIREDEFNDNNFLLTGYESEEERMSICQELMETASKELKTLSQPSLEFSMNMGNILALPEFSSLTSQFELGNFIRIGLPSNLVKRARLLGVNLDFDNLSNFSCQFGNLVTTQDQIDLHAELMQQAVQAGKQVATSASNWQKAVDKSNKLEQDIANGLQDAALEVGKASGQSIVWDEYGIWGRKLMEGTTDEYYPEQFRIINNKLVFSNDGFKTSKAVFGSYTINGETRWGPLAEYVTADTIEGKFITGGSIEIGTGDTKFIVNEDGSVEIKAGGQDKYASIDAVKEIDNAYRYRISLSYDQSTIFSSIEQKCTIICEVYDYQTPITSKIIDSGGRFLWTRISSDEEADHAWNNAHIKIGSGANQIILNVNDIFKNSQFSCSVDFDESKISS